MHSKCHNSPVRGLVLESSVEDDQSDITVEILQQFQVIAQNSLCYRRFQLTFHCNIPNFVAKSACSLRSSNVRFRIHKPVCKQSI